MKEVTYLYENIKQAFGEIQAEAELKDNTKNVVLQKMQGQRYGYRKARGKLAVAMACFLFLTIGVGGWSVFMIPVSAISVDVNPSVELGINRFDKVVSEKGYNQDGEVLLSELDLRYMDYRDAIEMLLGSFETSEYLEDARAVSITVASENEQTKEKMISGIASCTVMEGRNVTCSSCNPAETKAAHDAGMSFGKYKAFLELKGLDASVTAEEIKELPMHQIQSMIHELSEDTFGAAVQDEENNNSCSGNNCNGKNGEGKRWGQRGKNRY